MPKTLRTFLACVSFFSYWFFSSWLKQKFHGKITVEESLGCKAKVHIILCRQHSHEAKARALDFHGEKKIVTELMKN